SNRGPPLLGAVEKDSSVSSPYPIIGKRRSHIYHRPDCPNYSQVAPHNRVEFNSAAEAARYRVAGEFFLSQAKNNHTSATPIISLRFLDDTKSRRICIEKISGQADRITCGIL